MHHKNITLIVRKQLKKQLPNWKYLSRKMKKELAQKVLDEVVAEYDFKQEIEAPVEELLGIETQCPTKGIFSLDDMARLIDMFDSSKIIKFGNYNRSSNYIDDDELQFMVHS